MKYKSKFGGIKLMFEHFGLFDIWSTIKRYKKAVCYIMLASILLFGTLGIIKVSSVLKSLESFNQDRCISSTSYYVEPIIDEKLLENTDMSFYKTLPNDYVAILNSDFCRQYIYNEITSKYENDYIVKNSTLGRGTDAIKPDELSIISMKELYTVSQYENTMLLNVICETYDEGLSDTVLKACEDCLANVAQPQIKNSNITNAGNVKQILSPSQAAVASKNLKSDKVSSKKQMSKSQMVAASILKVMVLPIFIIFVLCCAVACLIALFNPTLNRKSDFSEYEIPILAELNNDVKIRENK